MKTLLAQNMPANNSAMGGMNNGTMSGGTMNNGAMADGTMTGGNRTLGGMTNNPALSGGTVESRSNLMGLGEMVAAPNIAGTPEQYGGSDATRMRASGGPIPGLSQVNAGQTSPGKESSDVEILNAALLLEYLESEFYSRVVAADQARPYLRGRVQVAAQTLARDEASHVQTVTEMITKLGGTPVEKPQFQFPANVFISPIAFLQLSVELEENGVGAYLGAAPMVKNKDVLNFAASIYGIEARHTAWIRFLLGDQFAPRDLEQPRTIAEATANARPFIVGSGAMTADPNAGAMAEPMTQPMAEPMPMPR